MSPDSPSRISGRARARSPVRGVSAGQIVRDQPGVKEQVGVYLDESVISLSLFTPDIDLFDLNRVETLRGPQGTLFGSGSVGGTIRYITNQPDVNSFEGMVEGNLNLVGEDDIGGHLKGMINAPGRRWGRDPRGRILHPVWRLRRRVARRAATSTRT
jgi:iron complex outermembrane receptor protein